MNDNNLQGIRQVTPEEIAKVEGIPLTPEELQKTQVLNLQEVEEAARFEKRTSKKPAIIVAIIGALLLTFGTTFQITQSMSQAAKEKKVEKRKEPVVETPKTVSLVCEFLAAHPENGTSEVYNVTFTFDDQGLTRETKVDTISAASGSDLGLATVKGLEEGYRKFMNPVNGYSISVVPNPAYTQIVTTVDADLTKIDFATFPEFQRTYYVTNVDYPLNTPKDQIATEMQAAGFNCN